MTIAQSKGSVIGTVPNKPIKGMTSFLEQHGGGTMRILFASQSFFPNIGGVSTHLLNLGVGLQQRGHSVSEVHLRPPNAESYEEIRNISVFRVPKEPLDRKMLAG